MMLPARARAYLDCLDDAIDAFVYDQISRVEFTRRLLDMGIDHFEARWWADQIRPSEVTSCEAKT
jgi:hypothetical protein